MEKKERKTGKEKIRRKIGLGEKERRTGLTKDILEDISSVLVCFCSGRSRLNGQGLLHMP